MKNQHAQDIAEEYQDLYEAMTCELMDIPFGRTFDMAIYEMTRIDTLADLWFEMAIKLNRKV